MLGKLNCLSYICADDSTTIGRMRERRDKEISWKYGRSWRHLSCHWNKSRGKHHCSTDMAEYISQTSEREKETTQSDMNKERLSLRPYLLQYLFVGHVRCVVGWAVCLTLTASHLLTTVSSFFFFKDLSTRTRGNFTDFTAEDQFTCHTEYDSTTKLFIKCTIVLSGCEEEFLVWEKKSFLFKCIIQWRWWVYTTRVKWKMFIQQ